MGWRADEQPLRRDHASAVGGFRMRGGNPLTSHVKRLDVENVDLRSQHLTLQSPGQMSGNSALTGVVVAEASRLDPPEG